MLPFVSHRCLLPGLVVFFCVLFLGFRAAAYLDPALQMQLGNPSNATVDTNNHNHYLIVRSVQSLDYSDFLREPNWASWDLTSGDVGNSGRSDAFAADTSLPPLFYQVKSNDYSGSGFDRGHLCPSADRTVSLETNELVFLMSNMMPQASDNNSGVWANFEGYCRSLLSTSEVLIICGPRGFTGSRTTSAGQIAIPTYTWKVAVVAPLGSGTATNRINTATRVIAIDVPNSNGVSSVWQNYVTTPRQIERDTALTFFTALPPLVASALRSKLDGTNFPPPSIVSFSPSAGEPNTSVVITGTNFTSATQVSFHGAAAVFSLDSNTQITATLPTNATSGTLSVTTPSGTATSLNSFTVIQPTSVDLAVSCSHSGTFTQGDTNDVYTVIVTNVSALASSGTVTISNSLPSGLTAVSIGGSGWSTDLPTLTCTRSDSLGLGSAYPPITLTVAVTPSAPVLVTNIVTISGGGDTNLANNTAFDPTTIIQTGAPAIVLAGWDVNTQSNYGISPLLSTTSAAHLAVGPLVRGSGVSTNGTPAQRGWGGNAWTTTSTTNAIASNQFLTCTLAASNGYAVSLAAISRFDYRRSSTGPPTGLLQYQLGSGPFTDITPLYYTATTNVGSSLGSIDLSSIPALQNVGAGTNVTLRIVNYGGTSSVGNWYIFDTSNSLAPDFSVSGVLIPVLPDLVISALHSGVFTQADVGDICTLSVSNAGLAASSGLISVTNFLPSGLTATAVSGAGWSVDLPGLSCTRSDALAPGSAYPPIQVSLNVATNAGASLTNLAQVSGGGQTNLVNDFASDVITVVPLTPSELWRLQYFGSKANSGPGADTSVATADGMANLYKYALGLDPLSATNDPAVGDIATGYLRITAPKNPAATDVTVHAESAADLQGTPWSTNTIIIDQSTSTLFQAHDSVSISNGTQDFLRLQVTRP